MFRTLATLLLTLACAQALADPPVRVARLAYVRGPVSFSPAGTDDWALASLNRPLIAGDRVWTDPAGRDELQLGGAALRMDGATLLSILTLDDRALQVQLSQGTLNVRVWPGPAAGLIEVDTPNMAVTIDQPGHYRIGVDPAGDTTFVRVDDGQAQVMGQYQTFAANPGQYLRFAGPDLRNAQALDPRYRDDFDRWCAQRDRRADRALATRYVSPATIGYTDLDDYGEWRTVPTYGHVWMPRGVRRDWAPYRDGHWAWIEPWGWTWIDDEPWGFATTHYGRWANLDGGWAWVPEPANAMPVYAPALVVFAAIGADMLRSHREPAVAWFPLGPREAYRPPYPASPRYVSAINYNNGASNAYANRQVHGAVTAIPVSAFARAQPVRRVAMDIPRERLAQVAVAAAPLVQARHESLASHLTGGHRPTPALLARPAMTHMQPAIAHGAMRPAVAGPAARGQIPPPVPMHRQEFEPDRRPLPEQARGRDMEHPGGAPATAAALHWPEVVQPGRHAAAIPVETRMPPQQAGHFKQGSSEAPRSAAHIPHGPPERSQPAVRQEAARMPAAVHEARQEAARMPAAVHEAQRPPAAHPQPAPREAPPAAAPHAHPAPHETPRPPAPHEAPRPPAPHPQPAAQHPEPQRPAHEPPPRPHQMPHPAQPAHPQPPPRPEPANGAQHEGHGHKDEHH